MEPKNFVLIGAAGYIAPRHMKAIKDTGNNLVAILDKCDSVGIIDSYFPDADFFTEFERFDRHIDKLRRTGKKIDYVSICTPNYLHDAHIRFALRSDADAICEKPLVLNPWNLDALEEIEAETGHKINTILQLRLHEAIQLLKKKIDSEHPDKIHDIELTYITSRGKWYYYSWKGDESKSGGIVTNIGIHFFDMLMWIFGTPKLNIVNHYSKSRAAGYLELEKARIKWFLSLEYEDIPGEIKAQGQRTYRSLTIDGEEIEFSGGFTELHTKSYEKILEGKGFGINDVRPAIETVFNIRTSKPLGKQGDYHSFLNKITI